MARVSLILGGARSGKSARALADLVVRDAAESVSEPRLRINAVQLGGFYQRIGDGGGFAPAF
jgi:hypothetical protein